MKNYKIVIEYDGTDFNGWQIQPEKPTVQGKIQDTIKQISHEDVSLHGSGRTDSGVHAVGQVANFSLRSEIDISSFKKSMNALLKPSISISSIEEVSSIFHSRFSARSRLYSYNITTEYMPIERIKFWYVDYDLDRKLLDECAKIVIGEHDFSSFSKQNIDVENKICNIMESFWKYDNHMLRYCIKSNRFIHHMVRFIVGTMIEVARHRFSVNDFIQLLSNSSSRVVFKAPAKGLVLESVGYE